MDSVEGMYPNFVRRHVRLDARNDLYVYFYLHGLNLLNPKGSFCFVTSNSWLDVGYGRDLQEFLLRHGHVKMILDNQVKRSFSQADVNTIIALLAAPDDTSDRGLGKTARFVMFTRPFEDVFHPLIFEEIEEATEHLTKADYRLRVLNQQEMLEAGMQAPEEKRGPAIRVGKYTGDKWGGKYLRAPDIYWKILEKAGDKLVRLGDIADVRFGIKTGCNEFFYLPSKHFDIQPEGDYYRLIPKHEGLPDDLRIAKEFLRLVIKSSRECRGLFVQPAALSSQLLMCHYGKEKLGGTGVLRYIEWGEARRFNEGPSCASRPRWWDMGRREIPPIISPCSVSELIHTFANEQVLADKRLYEIYPDAPLNAVLLSTNSTLTALFLELGSRTGLGQGLLDLTVYELADCPVVLSDETDRIRVTLDDAREREILPLREELNHPNRKAIDNIIFDVIGLTDEERRAVYKAVIQLVERRLGKAGSI